MNAVRFPSLLIVAVLLALTASAQTRGNGEARPERAITVSITADGARFVALGPVAETRLEVFGPAGEPLYNSGFQRGNVRDWRAETGLGQQLVSGEYLCIVTARAVGGGVSVRQGRLFMAAGELAVALEETATAEESLVAVTPGGAATLTTHDGAEGQVIATSGDLTLRTGDVFAARDEERVRITDDGRVGIGTATPEATLDVAGTIRAQQGVRFGDGTTLSSEAGRLTMTNAEGDVLPPASAAGTGTQNRLAKWAETGGAGTLADSAVTESGGKVGIGTSVPAQTLHVFGKSLFQNTGAASLFILDRTDGKIAALGTGGTSTTIAYDQSGIFKIESNARATIGQGVFGTIQGATTRLAIDASGQVGIGTETPAARLDVLGPNGTNSSAGGPAPKALRVIGGTGGSGSEYIGGAGGDIELQGGNGGAGRSIIEFGDVMGPGGEVILRGGNALPGPDGGLSGYGGSIVLQPGNGAPQGNVRLAPDLGLVAIGGSAFVDERDVNNGTLYPGLAFGPFSGQGISSKRTEGGNSWGLDFYTGNTNRLSITNGGRVGVGTSAPEAALHLHTAGGSSPFTAMKISAQTFSTISNSQQSYFIAAVDIGGSSLPFAVRGDGAVFATSFNQTSDRDRKTGFAPVNRNAILEGVAALPLLTWRYHNEPEAVRHIGPMAQDFFAAFGVGGSDRHITTIDESGVALAAIQALYEKMLEKEKQIETLQSQVQELQRAAGERAQQEQQ